MSDTAAPARVPAPPQVIPSLGRWGMSAHADLVYRTLVLLGPQTQQQLVRHLDVETPQIARALDELAATGVTQPRYTDRERRWAAADIDRVLSLVRRRRAPVPVDARYRRHLAAVAGLHLDRIPPAAIQFVPTRAGTRKRVAELILAERHEHLAINTEDVASAESKRAAEPNGRVLQARGIRLRVIGLPPQDGSVVGEQPVGREYRVADALPLKLMVFDRRTVLFSVDPVDFDAGYLVVDDADTVAHLTQLFYSVWRTAHDPRAGEVPTIVLTGREERIVTRLSAGASEEAVAVELGLSRRTVVYTLRALMDRIGVENRFQLALVLGAARAVPLPRVAAATPQHPTTLREI